MKLSTTSKSEALGNCNFPQIYSLGWFEATSTPTSLNTLSTFMIHEICRPQKKRMEKQKRIPESMIGGSNKFILVYLILSHNYTHDSSLLHQQLYMSFTLPVIIQPLLWVATSINVLDMERNHGNFRECELSIECWWVNGYNHHVFCPTAQRDAKVP